MNRLLTSTLFFFLCLMAVSACSSSEEADLPPLIITPAPEIAYETLTAVSAATAPHSDKVALAAQLRGIDAPRVAATEPTRYEIGAIELFWVIDLSTEENRQIEAELLYQSDELQIWVDVEERVRETAVREAATIIEQQIIPTDRAFFGTEWQPGIDGDNRIVLLHLSDAGGGASAYFSAADEVVTAVNAYSNQREMLYLSLDDLKIGSDEYFVAVAHELQHLIQWYTDPNEDSWLNEGMAELAGHVNGYDVGRQKDYVNNPDIQLTTLSQQPDVVSSHYAAAALFSIYFYERFGEEATQALVRHPANGTNSFVDAGDFDMIFADWLVANYLAGVGKAIAPYQYQSLVMSELEPTQLRRFPVTVADTVNQYGADYYRIESDESVTISFTGATQVGLNGAVPHNGRYYYATIPGDNSNMTLTRAFDLSGLDAATLTFWTWYDIESGWDYGYVTVSVDGGQTWQSLQTDSTTLANPQGNSFGAAYTGKSGGGDVPMWVQETADLTPFANQEILLRFQYITDAAVHEAGFVIDDIAIPELGFVDDAESDGDWEEAGIVRSGHILPQSFIVQQILLGDEGISVERLMLDENQMGEWVLLLDDGVDEAIFIVSGNTAVTRETAVYQIEITNEK